MARRGHPLFDSGDVHYTNGNGFHFVAVGATTPALWHHLAIYAIGLFQDTNDVRFNAKSPGLGPNPVPLIGKGSDHAFFAKIALPLGKGVSVGVLLSRETSQFNAAAAANPNQTVHYQTEWRPSGGFGVAWHPNKKLLFGFRGLLNNDLERRTDPAGATEGMAHTAEYRLGGSVSPWRGALVDVGGTRIERRNALAGTHTVAYHPNLGFEQTLRNGHLALRFGLDETSPTAGLSLKFSRYKLDAAYVHNMAESRVHNLFGENSNQCAFDVYSGLPSFQSSLALRMDSRQPSLFVSQRALEFKRLSPRQPRCYPAFYGGSRHLPAGSGVHLPA